MGIFDRASQGLRRSAAAVPSYPGLIPPLGSVQSSSGQLISQSTAMTVPAVYRAVSVRSSDVARCDPAVVWTATDGTRVKVHADDHPVARLFVEPNRVQTWFEFCRDMWAAYLLRGNAYAAILRDRRGDPTELIYINPDAVLVLEASDGEWFYNVNRIGLFQMAMLRDFPVAIPSEDILHVRNMSFNLLVAASTIGLARDTIGLAMSQNIQASKWIGNGARPAGVLEAPHKLSKDTADRLRAQWNEFQAGVQNTGKTAVLEEGIKWAALQLNAVDLQFINQQQMSVQDVARYFGVPPRKLMQPDTSKGSTIIQEDQAYVNETVAPDLTMFEQKIVRTFGLRDEGLSVHMDPAPLLRADPATRYNNGRTGTMSGLITVNEWRHGENLPPHEGGDKLMVPVNLAVLGSDMSGSAADGGGRPAAGQNPQPVPEQGGEGQSEGEAPEG